MIYLDVEIVIMDGLLLHLLIVVHLQVKYHGIIYLMNQNMDGIYEILIKIMN